MRYYNSKQKSIPVFAASGNRVLVTNACEQCGSSLFVGFEAQFSPSGIQALQLASFDEGTIWHEFLHAVGLEHTIAREDRDNYVKIFWENVIGGELAKVQFLIYAGAEGDFFGLPYDYMSLMHYKKDSHRKKQGQITSQTLDPKMQEVTSTLFVMLSNSQIIDHFFEI